MAPECTWRRSECKGEIESLQKPAGGAGGYKDGYPLLHPPGSVHTKAAACRPLAHLLPLALVLTFGIVPSLGVLLCANLWRGARRWLNYERDLEKAVEVFRAGGGSGGVRYGGVARRARCKPSLGRCASLFIHPLAAGVGQAVVV